MKQIELIMTQHNQQPPAALEPLDLLVTLEVAQGCLVWEWRRAGTDKPLARGELRVPPGELLWFNTLAWTLETGVGTERDGCNSRGTSPRSLVNRLRKRLPVPDDCVQVRVRAEPEGDPAQTDATQAVSLPPGESAWKWLAHQVHEFAQRVDSLRRRQIHSAARGRLAARTLARQWLEAGSGAPLPGAPPDSALPAGEAALQLQVTLHIIESHIRFDWTEPPSGRSVATGRVQCTGSDELTWTLQTDGHQEKVLTGHLPGMIRLALNRWLERFPSDPRTFGFVSVTSQPGPSRPPVVQQPLLEAGQSPWDWLEENIRTMAAALASTFSRPSAFAAVEDPFLDDPFLAAQMERDARRAERRAEKQAQEEARRQQTLARLAEEHRRREKRAAERRAARKAKEAKAPPKTRSAALKAAPRAPLPPVPVHIELPALEFQDTTFPVPDLSSYALRERAALWWVSNQSDDLLCLPHCRLEHLDYQQRTALRVLGPLRGRALLSDEVGLGKTIEAGLVLKELLTRGMVKRFLVLTVPSLVDQWEEELSDKFGLTTATTNQAGARGDPAQFWRENTGIIASLHTLKQPAQLDIARLVDWDMLIVDEAHYLRNRDSLAWQAVNALPRHFLLLLTATPVQNSLEELYNLVTLLQPGQLPSPKEFRARFIDPKRPRQPREPEELRRLLGQVMVRNTRANAGLNLPPRRAETVLFEPDEAECGFWQQWEADFRGALGRLPASQASLWGRLLLQAAGSSPMAWRGALAKFPDHAAARLWQVQSPLEASWQRKCQLLAPLTKAEGGLVIFTQFLETQAALEQELRRHGVMAFVINGATPPPARQPITEEFHRRGGALLLTRSGTEGRNLQFSHRLANFDLPWNPMEIEQRIGRLHRLGQQHPVRIYNFVQAGTLQEHLLQILQEKLNLFELVVGETGLVLGEKFSSDEFAEEVLRRWRDSEGRVAEALAGLGEELAAARDSYHEVKKLDETLFQKDYESL